MRVILTVVTESTNTGEREFSTEVIVIPNSPAHEVAAGIKRNIDKHLNMHHKLLSVSHMEVPSVP